MRSFIRTARRSISRSGFANSESRRSATQRAPVACFTAAPIKLIELGGEVVITTSMPLCRTSRIASGNCGQCPRRVLIGKDKAPRRERESLEQPVESPLPVELLGRQPPARTEIAGAGDRHTLGRAQLFVAMDPLRVVRCQHLCFDP